MLNKDYKFNFKLLTTTIKVVAFFLVVFFVYVKSPVNISYAQSCGSDCGWNGAGAGAQCVAYQKNRCNNAGGSLGCACMAVTGCGAAGPYPAACNITGSTITNYNQPASCCGGASTPAPTSPPSGGGGGPGYGACGGCSGCPGTNQGQCRTDPGGSCVWDPSGCGGGGNPQLDMCTLFKVTPGPTLNVGQTSGTLQVVAKQGTFSTLKIVNPNPAIAVATPMQWGFSSLPDLGYNYTTEWRAFTVKGVAPGSVTMSANQYATYPGYEALYCTQYFTVKVNAPTVPPTVTITATPATITGPTTVTLTWSSTNAVSCTSSGAWTGPRVTANTITVAGVAATSTYTITCTNALGSATASDTVALSAGPAPTLTLTAAPTSVSPGSSTTLSWVSANATSCTASGGWSGSKPTGSSSQSITNLTSTTAFTLACSGPGGNISKSVTVTVTAAPPAAPTLTFTGSPTTVASGASSTLTWSTTNVTSCTASNNWSGSKATSGSQNQTNITSNKSYVLACTGPGGSVSKTVNVNVSASPPLPTVNLTASPTTVPSNGSSTLTWTTTNATSCTASNNWSGSKATSGSQNQTSITSNKTYVLTCTGPGGSSSDTVNVTVSAAPPVAPTLTFTGSPTTVASGASSTLTWSSTNTTSCTASNNWSGSKALSGSQNQTSITSNKSYVLACTGPGGSISKTVNVNVTSSPALPTVNLTATPTNGPSGSNTTLSWTTTNSTSCTASNGWSGAKANSGSQSVTNLTANKTFVLTCSGPGGSSNDTATFTLSVAPPAAPVVNLTATPVNVVSGSATILNWTTTNATSCTASSSWSGVKATNGSQTIPNITSNSSFVLTCTGPGGNGSDSVNVTVAPLPLPTVNLTANPTNLTGPGNVNLNWTTTSATSCTASLGWSGSKTTSGSEVRPNVSSTTNYTLTCTNASGSTSDSAVVTYNPPACGLPAPRDPAPPVCAPNPPAQNGSITWTWPAVAGADSYSFQVVDATTGVPVPGTATGMVIGQSNFNCRPNQVSPDLCSRITNNLPPGSYRSQIQSGSSLNTCQPAPVVTFPQINLPGVTVDLCPAVAWWQSGNGSVITQGNVISKIPATCVSPACNNNLIQNGGGGTPGIAIGGSTGSFDPGTGSISSTDWAAKSSLTGRQPDYSSFDSLIPVSISATDPGNNVSGNAFNSNGATDTAGYTWYKRNGDITITSGMSLSGGRKVILYVTGNVTINGTISYNPASSFFMIIARGDISISPSVTTAAPTPTLTGIFYSDGSFGTGASDQPLNVLGSVVANGGVTLERDLVVGNFATPAESFTVSPDLIANYPSALTFKRPLWREVAP